MLALTILSILLVLLFAAVLLLGLAKIMRQVNEIGSSPTSTPISVLAKLGWGVRAIERQTANLEPQARRLNAALVGMEASLTSLRQTITQLPRERG